MGEYVSLLYSMPCIYTKQIFIKQSRTNIYFVYYHNYIQITHELSFLVEGKVEALMRNATKTLQAAGRIIKNKNKTEIYKVYLKRL